MTPPPGTAKPTATATPTATPSNGNNNRNRHSHIANSNSTGNTNNDNHSYASHAPIRARVRMSGCAFDGKVIKNMETVLSTTVQGGPNTHLTHYTPKHIASMKSSDLYMFPDCAHLAVPGDTSSKQRPWTLVYRPDSRPPEKRRRTPRAPKHEDRVSRDLNEIRDVGKDGLPRAPMRTAFLNLKCAKLYPITRMVLQKVIP